MPTINVGRVRPLWKGTYDYQTAYDFFDWVSYNGSSYIVIASSGSAAGILPTNTTYWACIAEQGEIGPIGPKGEDGDKGAYIGQLVMSLVPISDSGVHLLDGSILTVGGIYDAFITKIAALLSTNPDLFCTQTEYDASVSAYGSCGKFVYTAGVSLRLPKISDIVQCTTDVSQCGALVEAGLPGAYGVFTTTTNTVASEASGIVSVVESESNGGASNMASGTMQKVTVDLSDASGIYGNSTTVQPQVIKALVYMVVSSSVKTEVEVDIDNITTDLNAILGSVATNTQDISALQNRNGRNIGETVFSLIPLTDAGLHLLDGSLLNVGGIYDAFITHIASLQTSYPGLFTTEDSWQSSVTNYGVCGKFVYTEGVSLRIPKITGFVEGTLDATALGDLVEAGLPNITGSFGDNPDRQTYNAVSGAIYTAGKNNKWSPSGTETDSLVGNRHFSANRSNPIYGKSTTVQPQAIKGYLYMVVATATKTDVQVNIDNITTDLNGKAGTDLSNLSSAGKAKAAHLAMPSNRWIYMSMPTTSTVLTMPADGYLHTTPYSISSASAYINFINQTSGFGVMTNVPASFAAKMFIPVRKGDVVAVEYSNLAENSLLQFFYAEGSPSE